MAPYLVRFFKQLFVFESQKTLAQWREKSFILIFGLVCIVALPPLVDSSITAAKSGLWVNVAVFNTAYLTCAGIVFFKKLPFQFRAWTGILVFLCLGFLSVFSTGPAGSGRIWLFSTSIFATLILGARAGMLVLLIQSAGLVVFYRCLQSNFSYWANFSAYSPEIWITTSITLIFLSIVCMTAMARVIKGIAQSLDDAQKKGVRLHDATRQLYERIQDHDRTIDSLRESEKRWHFALEGAGDGVWDWNLVTGKIFFSSQWKAMLGYDNDEITDDPAQWFDRIHPADRKAIVTTIQDHLETRVPSFKTRYRLLCKDGSFKWILDRGRVMEWNKDGSPSRIIGTHADISMIKELEDQQTEYKSRLQQAQKMEAIGTLAGGIAHDFNNILFPILGHAELLLNTTDLNDKDTLDSLGQIHDSALRARELVQQILAFSRQENTEYKPVKIQFILKEVIKLLRATIPATIEIKQFIDPGCRAILADAIQIHQITMNLATNAYHAMGDSGGELKIYLQEHRISPGDAQHMGIRPGRAVCLAVADTGIGMDKQTVKKIFDPFFTTKQKGQGTGLGLSVVHGIVKKMQGCINVYSEPGKGTEFKIYFPAMVPASAAAQAVRKKDTRQWKGTERILLVDDEQAILNIEKRSLERLGYTVDAKISPMDAAACFSKTPNEYDLVITDMSMPGMAGNELASRLLGIRPDIPILLCTGFSEKMTPDIVAQLGIRGIILKPVLLEDLARAIRTALDQAEQAS